jgi:chemotaxis protein MotB
LSSARAISVVQYLISLGVPAQRLVAAGFAEFQPLDTSPTEEAYKRNRRIELKLTER